MNPIKDVQNSDKWCKGSNQLLPDETWMPQPCPVCDRMLFRVANGTAPRHYRLDAVKS